MNTDIWNIFTREILTGEYYQGKIISVDIQIRRLMSNIGS